LFWERIAPNTILLAYFQALKADCHLRSEAYQARLETGGLLLFAPRIDVDVTKSFTHLVKAPLSVHPATGLVCMPFRPSTPLASFDQVKVHATDHQCEALVKHAAEELTVMAHPLPLR
jgi:DNA primase catalytic subunit